MKLKTYYKVKPGSDQVRTDMRNKNGFLVGNELYSHRVVNSALKKGKINEKFIAAHLTKVEIPYCNTYWLFGCRFETSLNHYKKI